MPSCALKEFCFACHRSFQKHQSSSKVVRPTSFSSGKVSTLRTTSHQLLIQSCSLPPKNKARCTWHGDCPPWQTSRYHKSSLISGVYSLEKCWQSVCTMYRNVPPPESLAQHVLSLCNSKWMFTLFVREERSLMEPPNIWYYLLFKVYPIVCSVLIILITILHGNLRRIKKTLPILQMG